MLSASVSSSYVHLLARDEKAVPCFNSDRQDIHHAGFFRVYFIEYPQWTNPQFPGSQRVGPERFSVSCHPQRFMPQVYIQSMQDDRLLPGVKVSEVSLCLRGQPDQVSHELQCSGCIHPAASL